MRVILLISLITSIVFAETWFASVQLKTNEGNLKNSAFLAKFDSDSASPYEEIKVPGALFDYPSDFLIYDDVQDCLYYKATFYVDSVNITITINRWKVGSSEGETMFSLKGSSMNNQYPSIGNLILDKSRSRVLFTYGLGNPSIVAALATSSSSSGDPSIVYQPKIVNYQDQTYALQLVGDDLYMMGPYNIRKLNLKTPDSTPEVVSIHSAENNVHFDSTRNVAVRVVNEDRELLIVERPLSNMNESWYIFGSSDTVLYNTTWSTVFKEKQATQGYLMLYIYPDFVNSKLYLVSDTEIYSIPYPDASETIQPTLVYNATKDNPLLSRINSIATTGASYTASGFSVAVTVLTALTLVAGAAGGGISALTGSGAAAAPSGSAGAGVATTIQAQIVSGGMQALQHPSALLLALLSQLQFMVILGQLGGAMPKVYTQFVSGVAWVMLGFKGASFGITSTATNGLNDGMLRFSQALKISKSATYASTMIILIIVNLIIAFIYISSMALMPRVLKGKEEAKVSEIKAKINRLVCKVVGHLFLFSYLSLCTLSVYQLTIPDAAAGFFAGVTLLLICTSFPIVVFMAVYAKPLPQFIQGNPKALALTQLAQAKSKTLFETFFKDPLCSQYIEISYIMAFIIILTKYLTGLFTGAVQSIPVFQVVLLLLVIMAEGIFVYKLKPYKVSALFYIHLINVFLKFLSMLIKLGITAANDGGNEAAGIAIIVLNGIMIILMILGVIFGMASNNSLLTSLLKRNQIKEAKPTGKTEGEKSEQDPNPPVQKTAEV